MKYSGRKGSMKGGSSPSGTAVGSGSRPTGGRIPIPTSAPKDPKGLGRGRKVK